MTTTGEARHLHNIPNYTNHSTGGVVELAETGKVEWLDSENVKIVEVSMFGGTSFKGAYLTFNAPDDETKLLRLRSANRNAYTDTIRYFVDSSEPIALTLPINITVIDITVIDDDATPDNNIEIKPVDSTDLFNTAVIAPPSTDPADYPACVFWTQLEEGTGTALVDKIGNVTDLAVSANGVGDPWINFNANGSFTSSDAVGNEVYAVNGSTLPAVLTDINAKSVIIECDFDPSVLTTGYIFSLGHTDGNIKGIGVRLIATGQIQVQTAGTGGNFIGIQFSAAAAIEINKKTHITIVWERSSTDTIGTISIYLNGIFIESKVLPLDPGNIVVASSGRISVGGRMLGGTEISAQNYNSRLWVVDTIPTNIATIVQQMAQNPNEFAALMEGIT